jgi:hypothetical protein
VQLCGGGELGLKPANLQVCRLARVVAQLQAQIRKFSYWHGLKYKTWCAREIIDLCACMGRHYQMKRFLMTAE